MAIKRIKFRKNSIPIIHGKAELERHDAEVRNKVIDEFLHKAEVKIFCKITNSQDRLEFASGLAVASHMLDEIAEDMKGGAK